MPGGFIDDPKHWHDRAAEMRVLAEEMKDDNARTMMLKLANDYDKLGDRAEERSSKPPRAGQSANPGKGAGNPQPR
jgi:hypothetical protein